MHRFGALCAAHSCRAQHALGGAGSVRSATGHGAVQVVWRPSSGQWPGAEERMMLRQFCRQAGRKLRQGEEDTDFRDWGLHW
jgi:hypothetical protein